jgi:hypothetical protein
MSIKWKGKNSSMNFVNVIDSPFCLFNRENTHKSSVGVVSCSKYSQSSRKNKKSMGRERERERKKEKASLVKLKQITEW